MPETRPLASRSPVPASGAPHTGTCGCSLSRSPRSLALAGHADFRFDLPRSVLWPHLGPSWQPGISILAAALTGYTSPPDHPPKSSDKL